MSGFHAPGEAGWQHEPLDDRDERDAFGEPREELDTELSKMCAHNDDYDPLGDKGTERRANL